MNSGQLAGDFGLGAELRDELCRSPFAAACEHADQVVDDFPGREAPIGGRVPVGGKFLGSEQPDFATLAFPSATICS